MMIAVIYDIAALCQLHFKEIRWVIVYILVDGMGT